MSRERRADTNRGRDADGSRGRSADGSRERGADEGRGRGADTNREPRTDGRGRRAVLRGIASAVGVAGGTTLGAATGTENAPTGGGEPGVGSRARRRDGAVGGGPNASTERLLRQQVDASLSPGVTLFDLNGDGTYAATVERASPGSGSDRSDAIHVTSDGRSTVDYAASVAEPPGGTTLGGLTGLTYDYYEGANDGNPDAAGGGVAPDETFLVVENADGRHGAYLTSDAGGAGEQWRTFDVLARLRGDTAGTTDWFEYTDVEAGYTGRTFESAVERFGADAELVLVGVGHGTGVNPATLDLYYDALTINGETRRFPSEVVKRTS